MGGAVQMQRKTFYDGSYYEGGVDEEGKEHGQGVIHYANKDCAEGKFWHGAMVEARLKFANGDYYEGQFHNKKYHGVGKLKVGQSLEEGLFRYGFLIHGTVTTPEEIYCGSLQGGNKHGEGDLKKKDKTTYSGYFKHNMFQGLGCLKTKDDIKCEGEFRNGVPHGTASLSHPRKFTYKGQFVEGEMSGKGEIKYFGGDSYEGQMRDGKKHGRGKLTDSSGNVYEGQFNNDYKNDPNCVCNFASGAVYKGGIEKDLYCGQGKLTSADGFEIYEGGFLNGMRDGSGVHTTAFYTYKGGFRDDMMHGEGQIITRNDDANTTTQFIGHFANNLREGKGITRKLDEGGVVIQSLTAEYKKDEKHGVYKKVIGSNYSEQGAYDQGQLEGIITIIKGKVRAVYQYQKGVNVKEIQFANDF